MNHHQHTPMTELRDHNASTPEDLNRFLKKGTTDEPATLDLIRRLCQALAEKGINYCHWKSNNALERSASGDNDLDLLVSRADMPRFDLILGQLGFKPANAPAQKRMHGVLDYFGFDNASKRLIHVHAHYQLILGHDMTKNFRLPIENPYLESALQRNLFKVPEAEFEFIVFVIRMVLKHSTWDAILGRESTLKSTERKELDYLQDRVKKERVNSILRKHLPYIDTELFDNCVKALQPGCATWKRIKIGHRLQIRLQVFAHHPLLMDTCLKLTRRVSMAIRRRVFKNLTKYRLVSGGAMIAIVGGDGAGKSTAIGGLYAWLSKNFTATKIHLGKPDWSWITITIRGILKVGNLLGLYPVDSSLRETLTQKSLVSPGYPWLLREVCKARDRYRTYVKARRFAANGGIVMLDRFPLSEIKLMDGPQAERFVVQLTNMPQAKQLMSPYQASPLVKFLVKLETRYYKQTVLPELLIVLRVDPEIAVQRKTDEDAASVRERSTEIWELDWKHTDAYVIDASKSKTEVLKELKTLVWSEL